MHCPPPPKIIHGKHVGEDYTYGKSVIYICDAGYSSIGNYSVTCIWNSKNSVKWSEAPRCQGPLLLVFSNQWLSLLCCLSQGLGWLVRDGCLKPDEKKYYNWTVHTVMLMTFIALFIEGLIGV